ENEKLCRALLPENREATLKGRKLISELVYELGGQDNPVSWQSVQKKYKEKYNEELAGEALKRMFTRDKAIKILETLFNYELQLFQANLPGHFFLQLKMPYNDLLNYYETELQNHNEAKAQMKNVTGRALRPKGNYPKQPKVFPTGPLYPTFVPPPPPVQPTVKKSLDVPTGGGQTNIVNNNVSTSNQPSLPTSSNAAPKKSKFDISPEEIGLASTKKQSFTEMINDEEDDIAEERKITVKYNRKGWEEESSVPAYEIGGGGGGSGTAGGGMEKPSRLDTPMNQNGNNGKNGVVEGEAVVENDNKKKKTRYTSRIVGQDFTDSEESGDDEDEVVSVKQREGQQNVISSQKSDGENLTSFVPQPVPQPATISSNTTFVPPPRLSGHRAGIHKFMQEKVEQRKMEGATTTTQQQPNQPSLKPKIKRYPVNYSSDEYDEDDNIFNEQQKPREKEKSVENIFGGRVEQQQGGGGISTNNNSTTIFTSSLPSQQQQQPQQQPTSSTRHLSTFSSSSINQQQQNSMNNNTFNSPQKNVKIDSEWLLVDKVEWLRNEANKQKMSHESRPDEGSFIFRKGNEVLVLTESDDKIRASKHCDGRIKWDAYFPKTEWKLFSITILGLVYSFMLRENFTPPYPICLTTLCEQDFLCFFTKKFGFSNHFLTPKPIKIDGVEYCCSEQFYMYMKAMYFDYRSLAEEIMLTNDPSTIKRLGNADTMRQRQANGAEIGCRDFDHVEWRKVKKNVMLTALRAKFEQNVQLFNMLIETEDALLIEASPTDLFWGIGCNLNSAEIRRIDYWRGSNQMGNLLMELREEFRAKHKTGLNSTSPNSLDT
uniref:NADAR domain-containing protein n=2 Tax=Meloidogyne TaxID=189290 RepID=A0A915P0T8_9BILA